MRTFFRALSFGRTVSYRHQFLFQNIPHLPFFTLARTSSGDSTQLLVTLFVPGTARYA